MPLYAYMPSVRTSYDLSLHGFYHNLRLDKGTASHFLFNVNLLRGRGELNYLSYGTLQSFFQVGLFTQRKNDEPQLSV